MKNQEAIKYLNNLKKGTFCTVKIPLCINNRNKMPITVMYIGKDREGRYNFTDNKIIKISKEFLQDGTITIDKEYNENIAIKIYRKFKKEQRAFQKQKANRMSR